MSYPNSVGKKIVMNDFRRQALETVEEELHAVDIDTIQVNVGLKCNQQCRHCHVAASPARLEMMTWETMEHVLDAARQVRCRLIDITGGAPEMNPHFRWLVESSSGKGFTVQVRTNLTVLLEPGFEDFPNFYRDHQVHLVASMPCYLEENVDNQRGPGVYHKSIEALKRLNASGYGQNPNLPISLVYNPAGPFLPPDQEKLENDYRRELMDRHGIQFTHLLTITNMPIGRFHSDLLHQNQDGEYMRLLQEAFNPATLDGLMCRHQISVNWDGTLYDCDFNLALKIPAGFNAPLHINRFDPSVTRKRKIVTGEHCFGCTAGCGSSCSGALAASA